jgi:uncharacterized protein YciI
MFVILLTYQKPLSEVDVLLEAHRAFLKAQYVAGYFLLSGPKVPRTGGVILAQAESAEALQAILALDPFYQSGVAAYEVVQFNAVASHPDLVQWLNA